MATTANSRAQSQRPDADMRRKRQLNIIWQRALIYIVLVFIALLIILPLLWMLSTSLKPKAEWFMQQIYWIPKRFTWKNYTDLFNNPDTPIGRWFVNSLGISAVSTVLTLFLDALAAYAYARLEFVGRKTLFTILLATLFMPGLMFLIPNFLTIYNMGLLNSYAGVILPGLAGVFGVFFLSQFFQSIPKELEEAAQIDGATTFQTFYQIVLPLSKPALATLAVITFLACWNDFLWPLLVLQDPNMYTLPPGLSTLQSSYVTLYGPTMAAAVIVAIPVLIIYIALQRFIVQSVANTGLKG
ncbi:carbohydrate ABC transporter permease [Dictyobacter aurantiacus]|uniref:Sugar ABC transporter permease n=1 Tax=Dictyobacter aurantiacus TaxID=1936993 RepID=A0A401ZIE1_9CHLR|nr:carbohydrate ABC transporter permease [Dictyobacter aurantiacus]GCE06616.1 sugar ABC transporter permease [Dictyobacter aurantiacus]